jgi:hypothetical protein
MPEGIAQDRGPYELGETVVRHRNNTVNTIVHSEGHDLLLENLDTSYEYEIGYVPEGYAHRPDLISNVFYGDPGKWWLLMEVNSISDPFEGFKVNDRILIPKLS